MSETVEEHFPEPCAVGGHGHVWCAVCMERWPCAASPTHDRAVSAHLTAPARAGDTSGEEGL